MRFTSCCRRVFLIIYERFSILCNDISRDYRMPFASFSKLSRSSKSSHCNMTRCRPAASSAANCLLIAPRLPATTPRSCSCSRVPPRAANFCRNVDSSFPNTQPSSSNAARIQACDLPRSAFHPGADSIGQNLWRQHDTIPLTRILHHIGQCPSDAIPADQNT